VCSFYESPAEDSGLIVYDGFIREGQGLIGCRFVNGPVLLLRSKAQTGLVASEDRGRLIAISAPSRSDVPALRDWVAGILTIPTIGPDVFPCVELLRTERHTCISSW